MHTQRQYILIAKRPWTGKISLLEEREMKKEIDEEWRKEEEDVKKNYWDEKKEIRERRRSVNPTKLHNGWHFRVLHL